MQTAGAIMARHPKRLPTILAAWAMVSGLSCGDDKSPHAQPSPSPSPGLIAQASGVVDFPDELRADDPTVNDFIFQAIETCASEDYEAFRLLWSAREEPITREEFVRGWQASPKVFIEGLAKKKTREGEIVYVVYARVELDPDLVPEPNRDIVLLLLREQGKWRMARAPRAEAKAIKKKAKPRKAPTQRTDAADPGPGESTP